MSGRGDGARPASRVPLAPAVRRWVTALAVRTLVRSYLRVRVEGRHHLPAGPAVLCFSHQNWADPFILIAALPLRPWLFFFGPKEEDMGRGLRNRLISWSGMAVPYRPGKDDLLGATRRAAAILAAGGRLAIAGEGRIHAGERVLLPLSDGCAYFALHSGVPLVPVAINGTGWLAFGRTVRVRIGEPILPEGRPSRRQVDELTGRLARALQALVADFPDRPLPGRFGRWLTELFNEWPEGMRPGPAG